MAFTAGGARLFGIGQFLPVKGQCLVTVKALGISLVVMNGGGRDRDQKSEGGKEKYGAWYLHSEKAPVAWRRSEMPLAMVA